MRAWFNVLGRNLARSHQKVRSSRLAVEGLEERCLLATAFLRSNLVSDIPGIAATTDPNLQNSWGLADSPTGPFWVADNNSGLTTVYNGQGQQVGLPPISIPASSSETAGSPTGVIFNGGGGFDVTEGGNTGTSSFIFVTEGGLISGWSPGVDFTNTIVAVNNSQGPNGTPGAVYKGAALGVDPDGRTLLYVANFRAGTVDVFDQSFRATTVGGAFVDTKIPTGFAPFNVQNIGGMLYVTYAKQDADKHDDVRGAGNGFVDIFNTNGLLQRRLIAHGALNSPWGISVAPSNFGPFSNDLLVGNFGDGRINAFDPTTGHLLGSLSDGLGNPIVIPDLWALQFGNGHSAGTKNTLFFTAGPDREADGLFGSIQSVSVGAPASIISNLPALPTIATTVPPNGDVNPYGVAFVPAAFPKGGKINAGDVLVSNFNASSNLQGTGSTIVDVSPSGQTTLFFQGASTPIGLSTALGVLKRGFVIVGSVPTTDGTSDTIQDGSLMILDKNGNVVMNLSDSALLQGPWDLTVNDLGSTAQVFVSNVLSGSITRINLVVPLTGAPAIQSETQIASGYLHRPDPAALEVGPTGLVYNAAQDILYIASTGDNAIYAISNAKEAVSDAGKGKLIYRDNNHLRGPLGLVMAPNGDLITTNGDAVNGNANDPSEMVEFTTTGHFVAQLPVDFAGQGGAFGLALSFADGQIKLAAVDDIQNTLDVWTLNFPVASGAPSRLVPASAVQPVSAGPFLFLLQSLAASTLPVPSNAGLPSAAHSNIQQTDNGLAGNTIPADSALEAGLTAGSHVPVDPFLPDLDYGSIEKALINDLALAITKA